MNVIIQLASSLQQRGEAANIDLATQIAQANNKQAVNQLIEHLQSADKAIQNDCIKVLYEIGERKPELITEYIAIFTKLLTNKNNRLIWGAMAALYMIAQVEPKAIYVVLPTIIDAANKGSVIARDYAVNILVRLAEDSRYKKKLLPLLIQQLQEAPENQLPMYAEKIGSVIDPSYYQQFQSIIDSRVHAISSLAKKKRLEKVIKTLL